MIVDGKAIAKDLYREIANQVTHLAQTPHLTVFTCAPNFETQKYLALKKRKATEVVQSVRYACMQSEFDLVTGAC